MRLFRAVIGDVRYQFKYGFYFLYLAMSAIYVGILAILPANIRQLGAAFIILSDPAALGFMFIGGILLLERGEGLHAYLAILPLRVSEYILAKVLSLGLVSTLTGLAIAAVGLRQLPVDYLLMAVALMLGSGIFTLAGLAVGAMARSVNHYLVISLPMEIVLLLPTILVVFGLSHPLLELFPGTMLLRALAASVGLAVPYSPILAVFGLVPWFALAFWPARWRFERSLEWGGSLSR